MNMGQKRNRKKNEKNTNKVLKCLISNAPSCGGCGCYYYGGSSVENRDHCILNM
jgi:hypothetical protein